MAKALVMVLVVGLFGYGAWWTCQRHPEWTSQLEEVLPLGEFRTLEIRYTADQIMESCRKELLKSNRHRYLESSLKFYPYLLMEVKYSLNSKKTHESQILWDLCDGEMVLDAKSWEKTHGFGDCMIVSADKNEFKVIHCLAKRGGGLDREGLVRELHLEHEMLDLLMERLRKKHMVVFAGNRYRLHLQNPRLQTLPSTKMEERLVSKTGKQMQKVSKRFSFSQVERLAKAAFGEDFSVRYTTDIYLPVHEIVVENPDGSLHTSLWNALNGKRIIYSHAVD